MVIISLLWVLIFLTSIILEPSIYFNLLVLCFWIISCLVLIKGNEKFSSLALVIIWSFTTAAISAFIAEFGAYLPETQLTSYLSGALVRNLCLCFFMLQGALISYSLLNNIKLVTKKLPEQITNFIGIIVIAYSVFAIAVLFMIFIKFGTPNSYHVDRFYYWENIAPSWGKYIQFLLIQSSLFLGYFYAKTKKKTYLLLILSSITTQFLTGEKFTGPFLSLIIFSIPYFILHDNKLSKVIFKPKVIFYSLIIISLFFLIILKSYESIRGTENGIKFLLSRIVLQSQMWWGVDHFSNGLGIHNFDSIKQHFLGFTADDSDKGMYYLMSQVTPKATFDRFYEKGITFTMAFPVNFIYFFSYPYAIFFVTLLGIIVGLCFWMLKTAIIINDIFFMFFALKFYYMIIRVCTMGEVFLLFEIKFLIFIFIILAYILLSYSNFTAKRMYSE